MGGPFIKDKRCLQFGILIYRFFALCLCSWMCLFIFDFFFFTEIQLYVLFCWFFNLVYPSYFLCQYMRVCVYPFIEYIEFSCMNVAEFCPIFIDI